MTKNRVIVIGASAGGIQPLKEIISQLPGEINASVFVVVHMGFNHQSFLTQILSKNSKLPVVTAKNNMPIKVNVVYTAPPDRHLILQKNKMKLTYGPRINFVRPAIDPLFSSAAYHYDSNVIGILLSGLLDDGTYGLMNIKSSGGITVAQDPKEAIQPEMPQNAIDNDVVDYIVPASGIIELIISYIRKPLKKGKKRPSTTKKIDEAAHKLLVLSDDRLNQIGKPSAFTCPECHGTLWEISYKNQIRYLCRIGHAYNISSLSLAHDITLENSLWAGVRALEESAALANRISKQLKVNKHMKGANFYTKKEKDAIQDALELRKFLLFEIFNHDK